MKTLMDLKDRFDDVRRPSMPVFDTFELNVLLMFFPYVWAKPGLQDHVTEEEWRLARWKLNKTAVVGYLTDELREAWAAANARRGASVRRSLIKLRTFLWILDREKMAEAVDHYTHFGKPQFRCIADAYDVAWEAWDDGVWINDSDDECGPQDVAEVVVAS